MVTTAPPPPADLAVSEATTTSAKVCWTPSTRATGYTVRNLGSIPLASTTDGGFTLYAARWVDWTAPALQ